MTGVVRILHVDNEPDIREIVAFSLALDPEFETRGCSSAREALGLARNWAPDLILLDVRMPDMDGPATLARLREDAHTAGIPVVFMTAGARTGECERLRALGALGVIPKPFDPMILAGSIRSFIEPDPRLAALRAAFIRRLGDNAEALALCRTALREQLAPRDILGAVKELAHSLAGVAGIYGYAKVSHLAAGLEERSLLALQEQGSANDVIRAIDRLLVCIEMQGIARKAVPPRPAAAEVCVGAT